LVVQPEAGWQLLRDAIAKCVSPDAPARYERRLRPARKRLRAAILRALDGERRGR
jgi:hypothetical protein